MADINFVPRETAKPKIAADYPRRESVLVDLAAWPSIAQRILLEERLLAPVGDEHLGRGDVDAVVAFVLGAHGVTELGDAHRVRVPGEVQIGRAHV